MLERQAAERPELSTRSQGPDLDPRRSRPALNLRACAAVVGHIDHVGRELERETGLEPTTFNLERRRLPVEPGLLKPRLCDTMAESRRGRERYHAAPSLVQVSMAADLSAAFVR
jgi:hypothetical protein